MSTRPLFHSLFSVLALIMLMLAGCKKDSTADDAAIAAQKQKDDDTIKAYVAAQHLTATRTGSGLYYVEQTAGSGALATAGKLVTVHYRGYLLNGTANGFKFDSSIDRAQPFTFRLGAGSVIKGWDEGVALMKKGETAQLIIPSYLAYGPSANGNIPPNSVLTFYITLLDIQ